MQFLRIKYNILFQRRMSFDCVQTELIHLNRRDAMASMTSLFKRAKTGSVESAEEPDLLKMLAWYQTY